MATRPDGWFGWGTGPEAWASQASAWKQASNRFTPFTPPPIPSGYYDPGLDAQRGSASRGLLYTEQDIGKAGRYAAQDYGLDPNDENYAWSQVGTVNRDFTRGGEDIATQRRYEGEDYQRNVAMLTRQYGQLARQQGEQARKYGVTSGGIALLSAAKRDENQALDRQGIDTGHNRAVEGFDLAGRRLGEDKDIALGGAKMLYDRGVADRGDQLSRARTEDRFYGLDVNEQKSYQAGQAGYQAPQGPANEFTRPDGSKYRVVMRTEGGVRYRYEYDASGRVLNKRRA